MRKLILLLAAVACMGLAASTASAATWPAHCKNMKCVNKHLNALHKTTKAQGAKVKTLTGVVNDLIDTNPPVNNTLQAEIDQLQNVDQNQDQNINNVWNQPALNGCWQGLAFTRRHPSDGSAYQGFGDGNGNRPDNVAFDGYFDLQHRQDPAAAFTYRLIWDACGSGSNG